MAKESVLSDGAQKALKAFEEAESFHNNFIALAKDRYRSYKGLLEAQSDADSFESKLHPPYVKHIVETQVASLIEDKIRFRIKPKPKFYSPEEQQMAEAGAKAHELLLRCQLEQDRFHEKQRAFILQNLVTGLSVAKVFWRSESRKRKGRRRVDVGARLGYPGMLFDQEEYEYTDRLYDGPCVEIVNLEDFIWHEAAIDIQRSPIIGHRVWMTFEELKQAEARGQYQNVDELKENRSTGGKQPGAYDTDDRERTKDMEEVIELWRQTEDGWERCVIGNRKVELRKPSPNPFEHGEAPFVVLCTSPDLFKVNGNSLVGNIAHLQDASHEFLNQMRDNVRLQNNWIMAVDTTRADPDDMDFAPGERWEVEGPINEIVQQFTPDVTTAQLAMPFIGMLQNDMQNLAGGHPFTSTSEAGRQGSDTATEAALVSNIANASAKQMKLQLNYAYERIGQQMLELNRQFIRRPVMIEVLGLDEKREMVEIAPWLLQGEHTFDCEPMGESLMRQERRAEANAMMQVFLQMIQPTLALAQAGVATPLNADAFNKHWLKEYVDDPTPFFSAKPPPPTPMPQGGGGPGQPPSPEPMNGGGMTAPQAVNPVNSPSNAGSVSPEVMMQRQMARMGGAYNAPA